MYVRYIQYVVQKQLWKRKLAVNQRLATASSKLTGLFTPFIVENQDTVVWLQFAQDLFKAWHHDLPALQEVLEL